MPRTLAANDAGPVIFRFGLYELDLPAGQLRNAGRRVRLAPQPWKVLRYLVERPGTLVSRDELVRHVWGDGVTVNFDAGLASAIRQVRSALHDPADTPRFIETVHRRGYRFIAPVATQPLHPGLHADGAGANPSRVLPGRLGRRATAVVPALVMLVVVAALIATGIRKHGGAAAAAEEAFHRGQLALRSDDPSAGSTAEALFRQALDADPRHTAARTGLAESLLVQGYGGAVPLRDAYAEACHEIEQVRRTPDLDATAWVIRARCRWLLERNWSGARDDFERAIEREPANGHAHRMLALLLSGLGEHEAAIESIENARRVSPWLEHVHQQRGWVLFFAREYELAAAAFHDALEIGDRPMLAHHGLSEVYRRQERLDEAYEHVQAMLGPAGAEPATIARIHGTRGGEGWRDVARWWQHAIENGQQEVPIVEQAVLALRGGNRSAALRLLESGIESLDLASFLLEVDPRLDPLRGEPEFADLIARTHERRDQDTVDRKSL